MGPGIGRKNEIEYRAMYMPGRNDVYSNTGYVAYLAARENATDSLHLWRSSFVGNNLIISLMRPAVHNN